MKGSTEHPPQCHFNPCLAELLSVWSVLRYLNNNYLNHTQEMLHKEDWGQDRDKKKDRKRGKLKPSG